LKTAVSAPAKLLFSNRAKYSSVDMIEITAEQQTLYIETAKGLIGSERRIFMAGVVQGLGRGGQRYAEKPLAGTGARCAKG
jgi:hypothetical protein